MKTNGYALSRQWFDWSFENPDKATSNHCALYMWLVEINNRLGWVDKFQITSTECMQGMCCKSYKTYKKCLDDLIQWGFVLVVLSSKNQYQCNIIALVKNTKANTKALTKAMLKHLPTQVQSIDQSTSHIHKPTNHKPQTSNLKREVFTPPSENEVYNFMSLEVNSKRLEWSDEKINSEAAKFFNYYESKGWLVGSVKMKSWQASARKWMQKSSTFENQNTINNGKQSVREARQTELERFKAEQLAILARGNFGA